jgi:pilus assembly protein Flp/PilA
MNRFITRFLKDESGATAIEYGIIAAGIAVVCIAAIRAVGTDLRAMFTAIAGAI